MTPIRRRLSWSLWLALLSFGVVVAWVAFEVRWLYPDLQRHFGPVGDPQVGQQLITQSREHLQKGLHILASEPLDDEQLEAAFFQFELGYSYMNIGLYRARYDCVIPSLARLDSLLVTLTTNTETDLATMVRSLNPVIRCATETE